MKTDALIDMLARDAGPVPRALAARRLSPAAAAGLLVSALIAIAWFGAIPAQMFATAVPWTKMAYAGALALAAGWWTARLSRPAAPIALPRRVTVLVLLAMVVVGGFSLASTPAGARLDALLGESWPTCPWSVLVLSLPALAGSLWAVRGRIRRADAVGGVGICGPARAPHPVASSGSGEEARARSQRAVIRRFGMNAVWSAPFGRHGSVAPLSRRR